MNSPIVAFDFPVFSDYPGNSSFIIFLSDCNLREKCRYCFSKHIVDGIGIKSVQEVLYHLYKNVDLINSVVISGGEPLLHQNFLLNVLLPSIKELGYKIKLDTTLTKCSTSNFFNLINGISFGVKPSTWLTEIEYCNQVVNMETIFKHKLDFFEFRITIDSMDIFDSLIDSTNYLLIKLFYILQNSIYSDYYVDNLRFRITRAQYIDEKSNYNKFHSISDNDFKLVCNKFLHLIEDFGLNSDLISEVY